MRNGKCINDRIDVFRAFAGYAKRTRDGVPGVTVSLATRCGDFGNAMVTVRSLLAQTVKPRDFLLNIPARDIAEAPGELLDTCRKNRIDIVPCLDDMGNLNAAHDTGGTLVIPASGVEYEPEMLMKLLMWSQVNPSAVICSRCRKPVYDEGDNLVTYALWPVYRGGDGASSGLLVPCDDSVSLVPPFLLSGLEVPDGFDGNLGLYLAYACVSRGARVMRVHIGGKRCGAAGKDAEAGISGKDRILSEYFSNIKP